MNIRKKNTIIYTAFIAVIVVLDQLTKALAVMFLKPVGSFHLLEGILHLTYHENRGAAFGMLADQRWIFLTVSTVMIVGLSIYLYLGKAENRLYAAGIIMVIAGGIGNMVDRLALGYVVDFIEFAFIDFAIFNGADSFVCVGAGLLILALVIDIIKEAKGQGA